MCLGYSHVSFRITSHSSLEVQSAAVKRGTPHQGQFHPAARSSATTAWSSQNKFHCKNIGK